MCDLSHPTIANVYAKVTQGDPTNWFILGYRETRDVLSVYSQGTHGLDELRSQLVNEVLYGFVRVVDRYLLITWISDKVSGVRRARALVHGRSVAAALPLYNAQLTATSLADLSDANVAVRLKLPESAMAQTFHEEERAAEDMEEDAFEEAAEELLPAREIETVTPQASVHGLLEEKEKRKRELLAEAEAKAEAENIHLVEQQQQQQQQHQQAKVREAEEQARLRAAQEEQARLRAAQEEQARLRAAEGQARARAAQEEQARLRATQEEQARLRAAEGQAKARAAQEQARIREAEEQARLQMAQAEQREQAAAMARLRESERNEGVLLKGFAGFQPQTCPFWRRRYFTVRKNSLVLYRDELAKTPAIIIDLKEAMNLRVLEKDEYICLLNAFAFDTPHGSYQIFTDSQKDRSNIMAAIQNSLLIL
ncbi:hypothetical protein BDF14DRAFT_1881427 [Spinellus fusiger]|nr:hypothetical protein BDF14DRAFT_1881427 [Spinellus fusiger]